MAQQKVELRKIRDFGENINDTFVYISQNFKPLIKNFLAIAGIFLLATAITTGLYDRDMGGFFNQIFGDRQASRPDYSSIFSASYFLRIFFSWLSAAAMVVVITVFVRLYEEKEKQPPTTTEVWLLFMNYYFKVLFYTLPVYLLIIVGFVFCLIPGIYLSVVLLPFPIILIMEDATFGEAFNRCFALVKNNFWLSLGIYLVAYIIFAFSSGIISLVVGGIVGLITFFSTENMSTASSIVASVLSIFSYLFFVVFFIAVILHYYTLTEKLDATGVITRLNNLGQGGTDFSTVKEDY